MFTNQKTVLSPEGRVDRGAKRGKLVKSSFAGATAVAVGFSGALLGAVPANAYPGYSEATATYLSGNLLSIPLDSLVNLEGETAVAPYGGEETVTSSENLNLEVLDGVVSLQVADGIQVPVTFADAGVVGQYAQATPEGESMAAAGLVTSEGVVGVNPDGSNPPGSLTFDLSDLLGDEFSDQVTGLTLATGATTASAEKTGTNPAVGDYNVAGLGMTVDSPVVVDASEVISDSVAPLEEAVDALVGSEGSLISDITDLVTPPGGTVVSDVSLDLDLAAVVTGILEENAVLGVDGPVVINLEAGTVEVDAAALLAANGYDLNDLAPNSEVFSSQFIGFVTDEVESLLGGLVDETDEAVGDALNAAVLDLNITVGDEADPLLTVVVSGPLSDIADGTVVGEVTVGDEVTLDSALVNAVLQGVAQSVLALELDLDSVESDFDGLPPVLAEILSSAVSLTANGQEETDGVFTQTALRLTVLDFLADDGEVLALNLAEASVGPNATTVPADTTAIAGFAPTEGPEAGGTDVVIVGDGFAGAEEVLFGDTPATNVIVVSDEEILATSPAGTGSVALTITGTESGDTVSDGLFTYIPADGELPVVSGIDPSEGPEAGGTEVTISGDNFSDAEEVMFGDNPATDFEVVSDEEILATSPAGVGAVNVTVTAAGTDAVSSGVFTYVPADGEDGTPAISAIDPAEGPEAGGTEVVISGENLSEVNEVMFGDNPATDVVVISDEEVTAVSPAGSGAVSVTAATAGDETVSNSVTYTYTTVADVEPVVDGFTPTEGPEAGGTQVVIVGSGLGGVEEVLFGTVPAANVEVVSDRYVVATSPAGEGSVPLTVVTGEGEEVVASGNFAYVAPAAPGTNPGNNSGSSGATGYASCQAAMDAGVQMPINRGDAAYSANLDGDGDGIACDQYSNNTQRMSVTGSEAGTYGALIAGGLAMLLGGGLLWFRRFSY